jgi:hypothetical protein
MMSEMSARDTKEWAKEEVLDAIDNFIRDWKDNAPEVRGLDEINALYLQRNRVAKLFNLPTTEVSYGRTK